MLKLPRLKYRLKEEERPVVGGSHAEQRDDVRSAPTRRLSKLREQIAGSGPQSGEGVELGRGMLPVGDPLDKDSLLQRGVPTRIPRRAAAGLA